jgi:spore coat protein A, manganese oxidase
MIQDKMFKANGELFYPAFPGDPTYFNYITAMKAHPPHRSNEHDTHEDGRPPRLPTIFSEFYGDHFCREWQDLAQIRCGTPSISIAVPQCL